MEEQTNYRPPRLTRHACKLTLFGNLYLLVGFLGIVLWTALEESRHVSLMPLGVPLCAVLAGATVLTGISLKENFAWCARRLFRFAFVFCLFLLGACTLDSVTHFIAHSRLSKWDWYGPMFFFVGFLNFLSALSSFFMVRWILANLRKNGRRGSAETSR